MRRGRRPLEQLVQFVGQLLGQIGSPVKLGGGILKEDNQ